MSEVKLRINEISSREYILSPAVQSGNDKESTSQDFYRYSKNNNIYLGCLGFGSKVKHCKTQLPYTIINFQKRKIDQLNMKSKINSTLELMYKSTHSFMFRLLNNYETDERLALIFEPFEGDSLDNLITKGNLDSQTIIKYFVEIVLAIVHMNELGLYNLNIRPENILVDECIKLTDYGLKMTGKPDLPKRIQDAINLGNKSILIDSYYSPEEINNTLNPEKNKIEINSKLDSWKCGILLFEMLTNFKSPFILNNNNENNYVSFEKEITNAVINKEIDLSLITDPFCKDLINKLLIKNPKERLDIKDIFNINYIKNISIDQREIDLNDNIINPDENEDEENEEEEEEPDSDDKDNIIKKLMSENQILKEKLSKELSNEKIQPFSENEIINQSNNISFSEEDICEEKNDLNDNIEGIYLDNSEDIYKKYKQLKEKYIIKKKKLNEAQKNIQLLEEKISFLEKEQKKNSDKKKLDTLNDLEKINISKISNISELSNIVINSINIFKESQNNLNNLIEKLLKISNEENQSLLEESKKYINNKEKIFYDILEKLNKEREENDKKDKNIEEKTKNYLIKETEFYEMKKKYELIKQKENIMKEKIKVLEDKITKTEKDNKELTSTINLMFTHYKESILSEKK